MRSTITWALIITYFAVAFALEIRAWRHMRSYKRALFQRIPLLDADNFTAKGREHRAVALKFYYLGFLVLLLALFVVRVI